MKDELKLNSNSEINDKINKAVREDEIDLVLFFKAKRLETYNGMNTSLTYIITGTDTKSHKEVWKAEFKSESSYGPSLYAKKSAKTIYEKLKADKIL